MFADTESKGFTVIEMLVTISIVTVIMGTVLFNYGTFNGNLALSSATQEMSIAVRQAQTYGLTVKEVSIGGGQFSSAYGVYFDPSGSPDSYYLFADIDGDRKYDVGNGCGSGATECVERFMLRNGVRVSGICDATTCPLSAPVRMMHITFLRPNPDAVIYFTNSGNNIVGSASVTGKVTLSAPNGDSATIVIESTGQVLVQ